VFGVIDDSVLAALQPALVTLGLFFVCAAVWPKPVAIARAFMVADSFAMMTQYAWWRITARLPAPAVSCEYALALAFLIAELVGIATAALSLVFLTRTRNRSPDADANAEWLASLDQPPSIDVLICSYNEEKEILERTIVGALGMDYPNFRVWMLDDSRRGWVKTLSAELGCRYLSRSDNANAKAGNINHALKHIAALPDVPEFVSILDADFVPTSQFLKRAMSLFRDPEIGVVQTPQHFVNPDTHPDQSRRDQVLDRRTAFFLRHRAPRQGRMVGRILLRHVFDRQDGAADGDRRLSDGFSDRGLSLEPSP
jgi:cellulose synthase (UDP-forming)